MPTVADTAEYLKWKKRIEPLSMAGRLRTCADLIDLGKYDIAETLAGNVVDELQMMRIRLKGGSPA